MILQKFSLHIFMRTFEGKRPQFSSNYKEFFKHILEKILMKVLFILEKKFQEKFLKIISLIKF